MARNFKNWLRAYMEWTSVSEAPDAFHFWTGVGTIAGAVRSCMWIDENLYTYTPNFFLFFVAPPGIATKSTSIGLGMRLLEKVPEIKFGPSSLSWQFLLRELRDSVITIKWDNAHGVTQQRAASAITVEASELGTFLKLSQEGLAEALIDLWDGKISKRGLSHGTVGSGKIVVENPWLHVIGATTPAWLGENFSETLVHGGLTSRILFIFGDKKRQLVAYPSQQVKPADFSDREKKLIEDLVEISKLRGPCDFTPEARTWGTEWYKALWTTIPTHMASIRFQGYRSRKQAMLHKIAIVLSASTREDRLITKDILEEADAHLVSTEKNMLQVFESIGIVDEAKWVREVVGIVTSYSSIFPAGMMWEQIYKLLANIMTLKDFNAALIAAVGQGLLERVQLGTKTTSAGSVVPQWGVKLPKV